MLTQSKLVDEIAELVQENFRGIDAIAEAERKLSQAEYDLDLVEQKAFLGAQGTVSDRQAYAKVKSAEARLERDLRRAEYNRIKMKLKALENALMASGVQAKLMSIDYRA